MQFTTCLHAQFIIPVEPRSVVLSAHSLIMRDGRILDVLPSITARQRYAQAQQIELPGQALLPGLINLHAHSAMSLLRGLADDLGLMDWLNQHIWPAEKKHVSDAFVYDGSLFAMAEMLRGGTTTVNDMYFHHEAVARAGVASGMRTVVGCSILDFPTGYAADADAYLSKACAAHAAFAGQAGVEFRLAPHAPYTVSDESFKKIIALSARTGMALHCHIHETADEVNASLRQFGLRPLQRLDRLGLLSPQLVAAHMVHVNDAEIALLARRGVHVAHNPASNLKLASGLAPVQAMQQAGVNIGIGTDGAASNNKLDLLGDLRMAALLAKAVAADAAACNAAAALEMATLGGARALGLADQIGSLLPGKQADVIAIDLSAIETQPVYDPVSQIVYAAGREQISHVWVRGRCLMRERVLQTIDAGHSLDKARWWRGQIRPSAD